MTIKEISVYDLQPYENNPRENDDAVEAVAESIKEFGFKVPIVIDTSNVIIAGHTRLKAAKMLGLENVPCIIANDLTEEQIKAFRLADNKTAELAKWNDELLEIEINELKELGFDMESFGFDSMDYVDETEIIEDEAPEIDEENEPMTQDGDLWKLGRHFLLCGDSGNAEEVKLLMNGKRADLLLTDPPYNVEYTGKTKDELTIINDSMDDDEFLKFLCKSFKAARQNMKEGAAFYIWHAGVEGYIFKKALRDVGWKLRQILIWNKSTLSLGRQDYQWKHEPCLYGWEEGAAHYFINSRLETTVIEDKPNINKMNKEELKNYIKELWKGENPTTIIEEDKPTRNAEHPTMKPVKLFAYLIKNSSRQNENVLDLFGGSGTTLIACEQLKRNCFMMEYDPKYCDVIIKRWEEFTEKKLKE